MTLQATRLCPTCGRPDPQFRDVCPRCGESLRWDDGDAAPAATVLLLLDAATVSVAAGGLGSLRGVIYSEAGGLDGYELRVSGLPAAWVGAPHLLSPGDEDVAFEVAFTPPRTAAATAGPWPLTLAAVARGTGTVAARARATLVVEPFEDVVTRVRPQRRSGRYAIEVTNRGNAPITVRLAAGSVPIDQPALRMAPGARAVARLRVRRRRWWRPARAQTGSAAR